MKFNVNDINASEKEVEITLGYGEIESDLESEVGSQIKKISMPGFRKGKVPRSMIKKMYGDALEYEAAEKVANAQFWKIAKENSLNPIGQPVLTDINFKVGEDMKFKVKFETFPSIEIKDYTNLEIEVPDYIVTDQDIEKEIESIKKSNSKNEEADEITGTDFLLDVEMQRINDDGSPFQDSKSEKMQIDLTNERIHPDIIKNAQGKKTGDSFRFSFEDKRKEPGTEGNEQELVEKFNYDIRISGIKKIILPALEEDLIKKITKNKVSTETELRNEIRNDFQNYYNQQIEQITRGKLINKIIENNDFTPPASLVSNVLDEMIRSEEERLSKQGIKNIKRENLSSYLKPSAEHQVKWYLLKAEIEKKEMISVSDEELNDLAKKDSEKTGLPVDKLINYYQSSNQTEKLAEEKLFEFLKQNNSIKKVDPEKLHKHEHEKEDVNVK